MELIKEYSKDLPEIKDPFERQWVIDMKEKQAKETQRQERKAELIKGVYGRYANEMTIGEGQEFLEWVDNNPRRLEGYNVTPVKAILIWMALRHKKDEKPVVEEDVQPELPLGKTIEVEVIK